MRDARINVRTQRQRVRSRRILEAVVDATQSGFDQARANRRRTSGHDRYRIANRNRWMEVPGREGGVATPVCASPETGTSPWRITTTHRAPTRSGTVTPAGFDRTARDVQAETACR